MLGCVMLFSSPSTQHVGGGSVTRGHSMPQVLTSELAFLDVVLQPLSPDQLFCHPMDSSLPGSSIHGSHQARILGWVAVPFSKRSSQPRDRIHVSCIGRQVLYQLSYRGSSAFLIILQ